MKRAATLLSLVAACRTVGDLPPEYLESALLRPGVAHTVKKGQTLWRLAYAYGIGVQELAEVNDLDDPSQIRAGQTIWIPDADRLLDVPPAPIAFRRVSKGIEITGDPPKDDPPTKIERRPSRFAWPLKGVVTSRFGVREGQQHEGLDIGAPAGTPIHAADSGVCLYSGEQRGYGNVVLVKHDDGLITIYAHNTENRIDKGAHVKRGDVIATVGQTGRASGPHLHFEVRQQKIARNPAFFLPDP